MPPPFFSQSVLHRENTSPPTNKTIVAGMAWSLLSFLVLGVSGIFFNILLGRFYGPEIVGIFNQVFAVYIVVAQLVTWGVQMSVLHYAAQAHDPSNLAEIITSALVVVAVFGIFGVGAAWLGSPLLAWAVSSPEVGRAFYWIVPGIAFFALNKVLLNAVNALLRIRDFAIFQSLRFCLAIGFLCTIIYSELPPTAAPGCLTGAEVVLFIILMIYLSPHLRIITRADFRLWSIRHLRFGTNSVLGVALQEANTRVDVIMLGIFVSDRVVGIYSIAALIVEGIIQLVNVLRYPINPHLSKEISLGRKKEMGQRIRRALPWAYAATGCACLIALILYGPFIRLLFPNPEFSKSWPVFVILIIGFTLGGGYRPFDMLLSQAGHPWPQTVLRMMNVISNVILNLSLIPFYGVKGAALATAISFVLYVGYFKLLVRRSLEIRI